MTSSITQTAAAPIKRTLRQRAQALATQQLVELLGSEAGKAAAARCSLAYGAAVRAAKNPEALESCSDVSLASCLAMSALTGLMPGGPAPAVWLVPKKGELQWWISHRGIATLLLRAGYVVLPVAVHRNDVYRLAFGEVVEHEPGEPPVALEDLAGVYLTIRRISDGAVLARPWLAVSAIERRRKAALSDDIWRAWPVEMALKTALHYAFARGILPVESMELGMALEAEPHTDATPTAVASLVRPVTQARPAIAEDAEEIPTGTREAVPVAEEDCP